MLALRGGLATYSSNTLVTNSQARDIRLQWGLSASQYAGFNQASKLLNVQSEEDLYYMNSDQRNLFLNYMKKYADYYDKLESSGLLRNVQEMQLSLEEFKVEIGYEVLSWVSNNREAIMGTLEVIMEGVRVVANAAKGILNWINTSNRGIYTQSNLYDNTIGLNDTSWKAEESEASLRAAGFGAQS